MASKKDPGGGAPVERKLIVAIDFGTTYSGVAWAETERPDRRFSITTWPNSATIHDGESSDKVPTKLRYLEDNDEVQWGFSVPMTARIDEVVQWFKLELEPSARHDNPFFSNANGRRPEVDTLVADYLRRLVDHLLRTLELKLGPKTVACTPMEFVLTVPAVWSDRAKDRTRQALQKAVALSLGTPPIHMVSEPEAAAIFALHGLDPTGLKEGDTFTVVDAGGGTVDIISYTIKRLAPTLELVEVAPGAGGLCGSSFLNMRFKKHLKMKLGGEEGFDEEVVADAMESFETKVKRGFTLAARHDETYPIMVPGLANNRLLGVGRGRYALKASDLRSIFEPVILEVIQLVEAQIAAVNTSVSAVLLVGGFGESVYLRERLSNALREAGRETRVMQPPNAWQAVVQGAVMKGLTLAVPDTSGVTQVRDRKARKHYGSEMRVRYDEEIHGHRKNDRYWWGYGGYYAITVMNWHIKRGDLVSENEPFIFSYSQNIRVMGTRRLGNFKTVVYYDSTDRDAPIFPDEDVRRLCVVEADLSHIPEAQLPKKIGADGQLYYHLNFDLEAVYLSASAMWTMIYDGVRYPTVVAEYV